MFLGMNPDQAKEFAERIDAAQQRLASHATTLDGQVRASEGFWVGEDAEAFRMSWSSGAGRLLEQVCGDLAQHSATLNEEVEQQNTASAAETPGSAASGGTAGEENLRGSRSAPDDGRILPGDPDNVSMEVAIAWHRMSEDDKQRVLQEIVDQELERQGVDTEITVYFDDIHEDGTLGYWKEHDLFRGEHIVIDDAWAWDPYTMNVAAHEARHAAQDNWVEQTEPPGWQFWKEDTSEAEYERIEREYGVTQEEIEAWRENDRDYHGGPGPQPPDTAPQEERDAWEAEYQEYSDQPLEVDARDTGSRFAEGMTLEEFQQYQRDAGVPVTE